jgi:hypothetical protein
VAGARGEEAEEAKQPEGAKAAAAPPDLAALPAPFELAFDATDRAALAVDALAGRARHPRKINWVATAAAAPLALVADTSSRIAIYALR